MGDGTIDLDNDSFKICLLTSSHTPDATETVYADLDNEVANGNGYTTAGAALQSVTWNEAAGTVTFDAADIEWTAATFTCRYAVIYDDTQTSPADPLVLLFDFGADKSVTSGTLTIQFNASGIFTIT